MKVLKLSFILIMTNFVFNTALSLSQNPPPEMIYDLKNSDIKVMEVSNEVSIMYGGIGKPERISDLPNSAFRRKLLSLPPKARATALKWMQGVTFPAVDVATLRVDQSGGIYYADTVLPPEADIITNNLSMIPGATVLKGERFM